MMAALADLRDALTWAHVAGLCALLTVAAYVADYVALPRCPEQIPVFGFGRGPWAHVRNTMAYLTSHHAWVEEGYAQYGKRGLPFALPAFFSRPADVVLPRPLVGWLMEQPEDVVSATAAHDSILFSDYNFVSARLARDHSANRVATKFLARHLAALVPAVDAEARHAAGRALALAGVGDDGDGGWASVNLWRFWLAVVPAVMNRVLVGAGLCRDDALVAAMVAFTDAVSRNCLLLTLCPRALRPVVGRLLALPNWLHWRRAHRRLAPVVERRLADMKRQAAAVEKRRQEAGGDDDDGDDGEDDARLRAWAPPEDFLTWTIRLAEREGRLADLDAAAVTTSLLPLEFASIHTTVLTGHAWLLDLLSAPPEQAILDVLADEVRAHRPPAGAAWTKPALQALVRVDSSIRESQRLSNFSATLVERVVVAPGGLRHPDHGWTLPPGIHVTVNLDGTHHDEELYRGARAYDALRFARAYDALRFARAREGRPDGGGEGDEGVVKPSTLGMVTTSDRHLAFGHGRHACPGRFFVAHELKLVLAHLLLNYDVRRAAPRPPTRWVGPVAVPDLGACIEVRRRKT